MPCIREDSGQQTHIRVSWTVHVSISPEIVENELAQKRTASTSIEPLNNTHAQYNIYFQWIMLTRKNKVQTSSYINFQLSITFKIFNHLHRFKAQRVHGEKIYKMYYMISRIVKCEFYLFLQGSSDSMVFWQWWIKTDMLQPPTRCMVEVSWLGTN